MTLTRRKFLFGMTSAAFGGLALAACAPMPLATGRSATGYGSLVRDPAGLLDLPRGFGYQVISRFGDAMDDGYVVPDRADGMAAFALADGRMALVRNHEISTEYPGDGPFSKRPPAPDTRVYDHDSEGRPLSGGTTTIVYDDRSGRVLSQHLSLSGTVRNCAGGPTPWGSWLSCEESLVRAGEGVQRDHGWVFEVPAAHRGTVDPVPLKAMGRFNHEAAAVDPRTGIVYLTEDRDDSLFYRFLPNEPGRLERGGRLQALALVESDAAADSRNWSGRQWAPRAWKQVRWVDLEDVESPEDSLRDQGHAKGAVLFARGEGVHFGEGELYFCCTSGGVAKLGQIMRYRPSRFEGQAGEGGEAGRVQIFVESTDPSMLNFGDNLTVAPNGHLIVCEDQYTDPVYNHLRGVTPAGEVYDLALLHAQTELAGACFSPDGQTLFVNVYSPAQTLAIKGPWRSFAG